MGRKQGFKSIENPALQFVSQVREAQMSSEKAENTSDELLTENTAGEKKTESPTTKAPTKASTRKGEKKKVLAPGYERLLSDGLGPNKQERKTRRVNFTFQPSLYEALENAAKALGMSANELCAQVVRRYLTEKGVINDES